MVDKLTAEQKKWIDNASERIKARDLPKGLTKKNYLANLIVASNGFCAYSGIRMSFKMEDRSPGGGKRSHPFFASLDHLSPGHDSFGHKIVCNDINSLKSKLPLKCFLDLQKTPSWKNLMKRLKEQSERDFYNINSIIKIVQEFDSV